VRSGAEIEAALHAFVKRWGSYTGSERSEAQTFLNELFDAYGTDRKAIGALFEDFKSSAGFMDLHWPGHLIFEMKKPGVPLAKADDQRIRYWQESSDAANGIPAARWVVLCNFHEFEIWEPGRFPKEPRLRLTLAQLPDRFEAFLFLQQGQIEPVFNEQRRELTAEAAEHVAQLYTSLADRGAAPVEEIQRFTMQLVWCMFAEDLKLMDGLPLSHAVETILRDAGLNSSKELDYLFGLLNKKSDAGRVGEYAGTRYVNGELFAEVASPMLTRGELEHLKKAVEFDWRKVNPTIFGSLLEGVLGRERRSALGAHYTHEADIMKIVTPTIVRPWRERIAAVATVSDARDLLDELCAFTVLDPACGCGNFLYVAYRELRALEYELKATITTLAETTGAPKPAGPLPYVPLTNMYGIDIERVAVMIARITLWMGHRQVDGPLRRGRGAPAAGEPPWSASGRCPTRRVAQGGRDHRQPAVLGGPQDPRSDGRLIPGLSQGEVRCWRRGLLCVLVPTCRRSPGARPARGFRCNQHRPREQASARVARLR